MGNRLGNKTVRPLNKKGSVFDVMVILLVIGFTLAITSIISFKIYGEFRTATNSTLGSNADSKAILDQIDGTETLFDYIFLLIVGGLTIVGYVFAFLTREHPIFFWINIIVIFLMVFVGVIMNNAYNNVINDSLLNSTAQDFPIQNYVYNNIALILTVLIAGMLIIMFAFGGSENV